MNENTYAHRCPAAPLRRWTAGLALLAAVSCQWAPQTAPQTVSSPTSPTCCETEPTAGSGESIVQLDADPSTGVPATILPASVLPPVVAKGSSSSSGQKPAYSKEYHAYRVPDLTLLDQDGRKVNLVSELGSGPVALNFVFTTCTTICPVMTATFSRLSRELSEQKDLCFVSISLDPEYDSPQILKVYSRRYRADTRWKFLTGDSRSLEQTYRAFNAVTGSKFNHRAFTLFKVPGDERWLRIEGMASIADLTAEFLELVRTGDGDAFQAGG